VFTLAERRELLIDFAEFAGIAPSGSHRGGGHDVDSFREELVERYIRERQGGALGFTDDELKGAARDKFDVLVRGEVLTFEAAVQMGLDPVRSGVEFDEARGLPREFAERVMAWLRGAGVQYDVRIVA
jgi:hypothetical protein